jgi:quinol monooxygenase YgiN
MKGEVYWMLELEIQPGRDKDFRALMAEMVSATKSNEPGALAYEWSTSADGRMCHILERYADSAAVMTHMATFGQKFAGRFFEVFKPKRFEIHGEPDAAVRAAFAANNPAYFEPAGGFTR